MDDENDADVNDDVVVGVYSDEQLATATCSAREDVRVNGRRQGKQRRRKSCGLHNISREFIGLVICESSRLSAETNNTFMVARRAVIFRIARHCL